MTITKNSRVRRTDQAPLFSRVDDELLGLDTHTGLAYSLNPSASRVWDLIDRWATVDAVCEQLEQEYDIEPTTCAEHVIELLERLQEARLIDVEGEAAC
jgi:hypothetical protein